MAARSTILMLVLALGMTVNANAALWNSPIKQQVDQAVQDAVTKILQGFGNAAQNVGEGVTNTVTGTHQAVSSLTQPVTQTVGQMGQQIVQDYAAMGQGLIGSYANLGQQFVGHLGSMGGIMGSATDSLELVMDAYSNKFCTPASFAPSVKKPAKFFGPGMSLELTSGSCYFNDTKFIKEHIKLINCTGPGLNYTKTPANFTSKFKSAPKFRGRECIVNKTFGQPIRKVLYVFDGQTPMDVNQLTNTIVGEMKQLLGNVADHFNPMNVQNQMQQFLGSLPTMNLGQLGGGLSDKFGGMTGGGLLGGGLGGLGGYPTGR